MWVHVDSPEPVDLGYRASDHGEFAPICTSPCDTDVPSAGTYRILPVTRGDIWGPQSHEGSLRPSAEFPLRHDAPRQIIAVRPATQPGLTGGIALLIGGGAAAALGFFWLLAAEFNDIPDATTSDTDLALVAAIAGGVAVIGGLVLVIVHRRSGVQVTADPPMPSGRPQFFGAPSPMRTEGSSHANVASAPAAATFPLFQVAF